MKVSSSTMRATPIPQNPTTTRDRQKQEMIYSIMNYGF